MKQEIVLHAVLRNVVGKKVKQIRRQGWVPLVLYGPGFEPELYQAKVFETGRVLAKAGMTSLISLQVEGLDEPYNVLVRDVQRDVIADTLIHIDLYRVSMTQKLTTEVPLEFVGTPPLVKAGEAMLLTRVDRVEIECLPADLVSALQLDIEALQTMDDVLLVRDIPVPESITILTDGADEVVRLTFAVREEVVEEEEELLVEIAPDEVEVIARGKVGEEEAEE